MSEVQVKTVVVISYELPESTKHIAWKVHRVNAATLELCEIVENSYLHPDSEGQAILKQIDLGRVIRLKESDRGYAAAYLLKEAASNVDQLRLFEYGNEGEEGGRNEY